MNQTPDQNIPGITTINGSPDLSGVQPDQLVSVGDPNSRSVLMPAGQMLDENREPITKSPDGATRTLDGGAAIKLGGEVISLTEGPGSKPVVPDDKGSSPKDVYGDISLFRPSSMTPAERKNDAEIQGKWDAFKKGK